MSVLSELFMKNGKFNKNNEYVDIFLLFTTNTMLTIFHAGERLTNVEVDKIFEMTGLQHGDNENIKYKGKS